MGYVVTEYCQNNAVKLSGGYFLQVLGYGQEILDSFTLMQT